MAFRSWEVIERNAGKHPYPGFFVGHRVDYVSLPEFMNFKLFGKTILVVNTVQTCFGQSTWEVRLCNRYLPLAFALHPPSQWFTHDPLRERGPFERALANIRPKNNILAMARSFQAGCKRSGSCFFFFFSRKPNPRA